MKKKIQRSNVGRSRRAREPIMALGAEPAAKGQWVRMNTPSAVTKIKSEPVHVMSEKNDYPLPDLVAATARGEASSRLVADYIEAIETLRDEKRLASDD